MESFSLQEKQELEKLKNQVKYCLKNYPGTRDCDKQLVWTVWKKFYNIPDEIHYLQYYGLPKETSITRLRRAIQNHPLFPLYLPTREEVARYRKINMIKWKEYMQYSPVLPGTKGSN